MSINSTIKTWQDKRIAEIEEESKNNKYAYEYYIDEYCSLIDSKAKNKEENNGNT